MKKKCGAKIVKKSNNIANQQNMHLTGERGQSSPPVKCVIIIYTKLLTRNSLPTKFCTIYTDSKTH